MTFYDIFSDKRYIFLTIFFFLHAVFFLVQAVCDKMSDDKVCRLFLHSTCYCASVIYVVGSGAHNYAALELIHYILLFGLIRELLKRGSIFIANSGLGGIERTGRYLKKKLSVVVDIFTGNCFSFYAITMLIMYCISIGIIRKNISYENKDRVVGLDTYSAIGAGLDQCAADITDEIIFSTYAGALETVCGTFQPTG